MKNAVCLSVTIMLVSFNALQAQTVCDGAGTAVTLEQFGDRPGAFIEAASGNLGGYLLLTRASNGQNNYATFDRSDAGTFPESVFTFDFLIDPEAGQAQTDSRFLMPIPESTEPQEASEPRLLPLRTQRQLACWDFGSIRGVTKGHSTRPASGQALIIKKSVCSMMGIWFKGSTTCVC